MNERIKELMKQADIGYLFHKDEMLPGNVNPDSLKKFAELIVAECAAFARQHNLNNANRSYIIHKAIEEHFGVRQ